MFAGVGGTLLFGAIGFALAIPTLLKIHRRTGGWRVPAAALARGSRRAAHDIMTGLQILGQLLLMALVPLVAMLVMSRLSGGLSALVMIAIIVTAGLWTMSGVDKYLGGR